MCAHVSVVLVYCKFRFFRRPRKWLLSFRLIFQVMLIIIGHSSWYYFLQHIWKIIRISLKPSVGINRSGHQNWHGHLNITYQIPLSLTTSLLCSFCCLGILTSGCVLYLMFFREEKSYYALRAQAVDIHTGLPLEPESEFIIKVQDINDNEPRFPDGPYSGSVPEMSPAGKTAWGWDNNGTLTKLTLSFT